MPRQIGWSQEANLLYLISGQLDRVAEIIANASAGGVISFNTRSGVVTLLSSDVTSALGYTPVTQARTLTINGTSYDLSADRSWTISSANIYTANGTLTGNRTVSMGSYTLSFEKNITVNGVTIGIGGQSTSGSSLAIGFGAFALATTANASVAIGYQALGGATSNGANTAIGYNSSLYNTSGSANVSVGYRSLMYNTSGSDNVSIGDSSAEGFTGPGNYNIFLGSYAGSRHVSGDYNIYVGASTIVPAIGTGSYNTIIGSQITGLSAGLSNNVIIGDGSGNMRLVINNSGNAYFGATTTYPTINASAKLEVASTTSGFLPPRMTTAQRTAIATPAAGLIVYDTSLNAVYYYNGTAWTTPASGGGGSSAASNLFNYYNFI